MSENNELSQKNQSFRHIKMPAIIDFYEVTGINRFNGNEHSKLQEEEDKIFEEKLREFEAYKKLKASYKVPPNWIFVIFGIIIFFSVYIGLVFTFFRFSIFSTLENFLLYIMLISMFASIAVPVILKLFFKNRLKNLKKVNQPKRNNVIDKKKYQIF